MAQQHRYGGYNLTSGDSDSDRRWGGARRTSAGNHVARLQTDLAELGTYSGDIDGEIGPKTRRSLRMFSWNAKSHSQRVANQSVVLDTHRFSGVLSSSLDALLCEEISRWLKSGFKTTGDLIRVQAADFANLELSSGFRVLSHKAVQQGEIVISLGFLESLKFADKTAGTLSVKVFLNQAFRVHGNAVSGAVVPPATKSQHLIGHAIDCNIIDGGSWNTSSDFRNGNETQAATQFIDAMTKHGLRWGGNFSRPDTPHFDKRVNPDSDDYDYKFAFNQLSISRSQPILLKK